MQANFVLGELALARGELEVASRHLLEARARAPNDAIVILAQARLARQRGDLREAIRHYRDLLGVHPDHEVARTELLQIVPALWQQADRHLENTRYADAYADLTEVLSIRPEFSGAYRKRSEALTHLDRIEEAAADLGEAIRLNPSDEESYRRRGALFARLGLSQDAIRDWEHALRLTKDAETQQLLREEISAVRPESPDP